MLVQMQPQPLQPNRRNSKRKRQALEEPRKSQRLAQGKGTKRQYSPSEHFATVEQLQALGDKLPPRRTPAHKLSLDAARVVHAAPKQAQVGCKTTM